MKRLELRGKKELVDGNRMLGPYECELLCDGEPLGGVVSFEIRASVAKDDLPRVCISFETYVQDIDFACGIPMVAKKD